MLRRNFLVIGFLVLGITALFSRDAFAGTSLTGISFTWKSIDCLSVLQALSKKDAPNTTVGCRADIVEVSLQCVNRGGNADPANSAIFQPNEEIILGVSATANSCKLDKVTGRWYCQQVISDTDLSNALSPPVGDECGPNPNFSYQLDVVTKMCAQVIVIASDGSTADQAFARCTLPPESPSGTPFDCTEISSVQFDNCSIADF